MPQTLSDWASLATIIGVGIAVATLGVTLRRGSPTTEQNERRRRVLGGAPSDSNTPTPTTSQETVPYWIRDAILVLEPHAESILELLENERNAEQRRTFVSSIRSLRNEIEDLIAEYDETDATVRQARRTIARCDDVLQRVAHT